MIEIYLDDLLACCRCVACRKLTIISNLKGDTIEQILSHTEKRVENQNFPANKGDFCHPVLPWPLASLCEHCVDLYVNGNVNQQLGSIAEFGGAHFARVDRGRLFTQCVRHLLLLFYMHGDVHHATVLAEQTRWRRFSSRPLSGTLFAGRCRCLCGRLIQFFC